MKYLRNLFVLLSLTPFLAILYIGSININKNTNIRILTWEKKEISLGKLLIFGAILGSSFSSLNILLMNSQFLQRRNINLSIPEEELNEGERNDFEDYQLSDEYNSEYIERDIREPKPTLAVSYKIINENTNSSKNYKYAQPDNQHYEQSENSGNNLNESQDQNELINDWLNQDLEKW